MKIHLFHVNDVHSSIENHMRLGTALRDARNMCVESGDTVLTFDLGDTIDRVRAESEATLGVVNAAMLEALGVDGWVFGNNEGLTIPVDRWADLVGRSHSIVFGSNLRQASGQPFTFFEDYHVYQFGQVKIGVFGLTPNYEKPYRMLGVNALSPVEVAKYTVPRLRQMGCDIVILLSHLGLHDDRRLAAEVDGIDLILGGHTHHFMVQEEWVTGTAIFQAGKHGRAFGHTVVEYDQELKRIASVRSTSVDVPLEGKPDQAMLSAFRGYLQDIEERLGQLVVDLEQELRVDYESESWFANALVDVMRDAYPADLGMMMSGALTASLLPGAVDTGHIHAACTTPTRVLSMTLTGKQIASILSKAIRPEFYSKVGFGYGFRGAVVGYIAVSNAVVYMEQGREGNRLVAVWIDGKPLQPADHYRVVTCEYLWLSSVFEEFGHGIDVEFAKPLVREVLLANLGRTGVIERAHEMRYRTTNGGPHDRLS